MSPSLHEELGPQGVFGNRANDAATPSTSGQSSMNKSQGSNKDVSDKGELSAKNGAWLSYALPVNITAMKKNH